MSKATLTVDLRVSSELRELLTEIGKELVAVKASYAELSVRADWTDETLLAMQRELDRLSADLTIVQAKLDLLG